MILYTLLLLVGLSKTELKNIANLANDANNMKKPICLIFTSEITVDLKNDSCGKGGRCQEVALATAIELQKKSEHHSCLKVCACLSNLVGYRTRLQLTDFLSLALNTSVS